MKKNKLILALPLLAAFSFGCSGGEDLFAPVESPEVVNVFEPAYLWSHNTGGVGSYYSQLSPTADLAYLYMASRNGDVYAYDKLTGERIWHVDLDDQEENDTKRSARLSGGISAYAGICAIGSENGYIYVLNSKDGSLKWKYYVGSEIVSKVAFSKSGDKLFVLDSRGALSCFDASSGNLIYVTGETNTSLRLRSQANPVTIGDDFVIVALANGKINIYLQTDGTLVNEIIASRAVGANALQRISDISATPFISGSNLYILSYKDGLISYDFTSDTVSSRLGYSGSNDLAYDENIIVVVDEKSHIYAISRHDNQELWSNTSLTYRNVSAACIYGNYVVVGDYEGYVYFLDINTGHIVSKLEIDNSAIYTAPLVDGNILYIASADGDLSALQYDKDNSALQKFMVLKIEQDYAGVGVNLYAKGVGSGGIYAPTSVNYEALLERRRQIIAAVAKAEAAQREQLAKMREYERQKAEYERRQKAYEEERRRQLSGFGVAP